MFRDSSGHASFGWSSNISAPANTYGAASTSNSSYQAAVPSSSGYSGSAHIATHASHTSNPSYQAAVPSSSGYTGSAHTVSCGASSTSNSSYQAAVPSSLNYGTLSSTISSSNKPNLQSTHLPSSNHHASSNYTSNSHKSSSKPVYHSSSKYDAPATNAVDYFNHNSTGKYSSVAKHGDSSDKSLTSKKSRSHSAASHASNYPNPNFIRLLPVETQFPNPDTLPQSMKKMSVSDQVVNFYPVQQKGPNYLRYCIGWLSNDEKPRSMRDCVWQYTSGPNWYCTEVNMALAADSPKLRSYAPYIRQLKYSIGMSPMRFVGTVFRGADMSPSEIQSYESNNMFFIPSFTSTSKSMPFKGKNTVFHIDITPDWSKFCMEIQPEHTKYVGEEEILFSCYNLYQYQRTEKSNGQRIIKLRLVDYTKYFDYRTNTILNYHN